MAISLLSLPARAAGSTGYVPDQNAIIAKINELAAAMSISSLTLTAALGAGNPAADTNTVVAKINDLITAVNAGTGTTPGTSSTADIVAFIPGQSNDSGLSPRADLPAGYAVKDARVKTWNDFTGAIETYELGVNDNSINSHTWADANGVQTYIVPSYPPSFGPEVGFIKAWLADAANNGKELFIFKKWNGRRNGEPDNTNSATVAFWNSTLYPALKTEWDRFKTALVASGYSTQRFLLLCSGLGEGDAEANNTNFLNDYTRLVNKIEREISGPGIRKLIAKKQPSQYATVAGYQAQYVAAHPEATLLDVATPVFTDGIHYSADTMRRLGELEYATWGGTVQTVPAAPTASTVDDASNLYGWTPNPTFAAINEQEYTKDNDIYIPVTARPQPVGDINAVPGQVGVRVRASINRRASATLYNGLPFGAATAGFTEEFNDSALPGWTAVAVGTPGTNGASGGVLSLAPAPNLASTNYSGYSRTVALEGVGFRFLVKLDQVTAQETTGEAVFALQSGPGLVATEHIRFIVSGGLLLCQDSANVASPNYNATTMKYLAFSFTGAPGAEIVNWETSPDGVTWTVRATKNVAAIVVQNFDVHALRLLLYAGTYGPAATPGSALYDRAAVVPL